MGSMMPSFEDCFNVRRIRGTVFDCLGDMLAFLIDFGVAGAILTLFDVVEPGAAQIRFAFQYCSSTSSRALFMYAPGFLL